MNIKAATVKRIGYCREIKKGGADEILWRCCYPFLHEPPRALHCPHIGTKVSYMYFQSTVGVYLHLYIVAIFAIYCQPIDLIFYYEVNVTKVLSALQEIVSDDSAEDIYIALCHNLTEYGRCDGVHHLVAEIAQKSTVPHALYIFIEITKYVVH